MRIAVVGMGKIGLPLAVQYAMKGHAVVGCDINSATVDMINRAHEPFPGEFLLAENLAQVVSNGTLRATVDTADAVRDCDVVVIVVPLFVDDEARPEFSAMDAATRSVAAGLRPGTLVSYETTLPVGTTRTRLTPLLESTSGLKAGDDFFVVFSPERVLTGRVFADLRSYPKLVGGLDSSSEERGISFYESVLDFDDRPDLPRPNGVWGLGSAEAAELAKLAETTYRDVNIALANQFALFAATKDINIHAVIEACNSQPFSHIHRPGIAVGGHCIPVYPRLYLWNDPAATVVKAARDANAANPEAWVQRLETQVGSLQAKLVAVLGAAYRGGVKETAFSGVFDVVEAIKARGGVPVVHDPLYSDDELQGLGLTPFSRGSRADLVVMQADHEEYRMWSEEDVPGVTAVLAGRRILDQTRWPSVAFIAIGG
jgi:nucleotide sugar dehydrogenase